MERYYLIRNIWLGDETARVNGEQKDNKTQDQLGLLQDIQTNILREKMNKALKK